MKISFNFPRRNVKKEETALTLIDEVEILPAIQEDEEEIEIDDPSDPDYYKNIADSYFVLYPENTLDRFDQLIRASSEHGMTEEELETNLKIRSAIIDMLPTIDDISDPILKNKYIRHFVEEEEKIKKLKAQKRKSNIPLSNEAIAGKCMLVDENDPINWFRYRVHQKSEDVAHLTDLDIAEIVTMIRSALRSFLAEANYWEPPFLIENYILEDVDYSDTTYDDYNDYGEE